jgi:hypothetical protein
VEQPERCDRHDGLDGLLQSCLHPRSRGVRAGTGRGRLKRSMFATALTRFLQGFDLMAGPRSPLQRSPAIG